MTDDPYDIFTPAPGPDFDAPIPLPGNHSGFIVESQEPRRDKFFGEIGDKHGELVEILGFRMTRKAVLDDLINYVL